MAPLVAGKCCTRGAQGPRRACRPRHRTARMLMAKAALIASGQGKCSLDKGDPVAATPDGPASRLPSTTAMDVEAIRTGVLGRGVVGVRVPRGAVCAGTGGGLGRRKPWRTARRTKATLR